MMCWWWSGRGEVVMPHGTTELLQLRRRRRREVRVHGVWLVVCVECCRVCGRARRGGVASGGGGGRYSSGGIMVLCRGRAMVNKLTRGGGGG